MEQDSQSRVAITKDPQHVKSGGGALSYSYELEPKTKRILTLQRPLELCGIKPMRFGVQCSSSTSVIVGLNEAGGASYQAAAYCAAGCADEVVQFRMVGPGYAAHVGVPPRAGWELLRIELIRQRYFCPSSQGVRITPGIL